MINGFGTMFRPAEADDPLGAEPSQAEMVTLRCLQRLHQHTHEIWYGAAPQHPGARFHARAKDLNGHPWCVQTDKITELVDAFGGLPE